MGAMFARRIGVADNPGYGTHRDSISAVATTVYISRYMRTGVFSRGLQGCGMRPVPCCTGLVYVRLTL
jgi:hypothetical protein